MREGIFSSNMSGNYSERSSSSSSRSTFVAPLFLTKGGTLRCCVMVLVVATAADVAVAFLYSQQQQCKPARRVDVYADTAFPLVVTDSVVAYPPPPQ